MCIWQTAIFKLSPGQIHSFSSWAPFFIHFARPFASDELKWENQGFYKICCARMLCAVRCQRHVLSFYSTWLMGKQVVPLWGQLTCQAINTEPWFYKHCTENAAWNLFRNHFACLSTLKPSPSPQKAHDIQQKQRTSSSGLFLCGYISWYLNGRNWKPEKKVINIKILNKQYNMWYILYY